jgi:2-oxoacid:acceptor oxidoreductase delta subunit (pyruvate/2-ketoisovalerate family)
MTASKTRKILGPCATEFTAMNTGSWRLERPVVDLNVCIACGTCERNCPADIIVVTKSPKNVVIDMNYCKGCGICSEVCPKNCIAMQDEKGGPQ